MELQGEEGSWHLEFRDDWGTWEEITSRTRDRQGYLGSANLIFYGALPNPHENHLSMCP
ncbi:unnamed protein product [Sphenostylis stenocarpa]|uniref:Uncharacterized protein n=1 Tax=Sphenostylis stenocarpa TaxID=92480 RepID=A0AA86SUV0_9FABA|nr:unnamed protein product [Sphenostylis stenocarpa]